MGQNAYKQIRAPEDVGLHELGTFRDKICKDFAAAQRNGDAVIKKIGIDKSYDDGRVFSVKVDGNMNETQQRILQQYAIR